MKAASQATRGPIYVVSMAGYSGTPLPKKLGIKPYHRVLLHDAPANFARTLGPLPNGAELVTRVSAKARFDVAVAFFMQSRALPERFATLVKAMNPAAGLWIAWPKKAAKLETDMHEGLVRELGLATGLVDNKVCAIDETWSGLRFVIRVKDR